jgi:NAD(P)-dependent dehydrogenase (short-subunit alcohol dehydrogenase family)
MDLGIAGKVALVTGGGSGIGLAVVKELALNGCKVFFTTRKQIQSSLKDELANFELTPEAVIIDAASEDGPKSIHQILNDKGVAVSILVNNIGDTLGITDPFCSLEDWRKVYRLNLECHVEMNNLFLPGMMKNGWGRIVNISANASLENSGPVPYCAIKAAYTAYSRSMARVLAKSGVVMSAVLPGVVITEKGHWQNILKTNPEHAEKYLLERTPMERFGKTDEISPFVALLCSQLASFAVGSIHAIDGGQARHYYSGNLDAFS